VKENYKYYLPIVSFCNSNQNKYPVDKLKRYEIKLIIEEVFSFLNKF
jgi:hypothetical protein